MLQRSTCVSADSTPETSSGASHVVIDVETCSELNLAKVGASKYAKHPTTWVRVVAFTIDDGDPIIWNPKTEPVPPAQLVSVAADRDVKFAAHNAGFEIEIWQQILIPQHGLPPIDIARWICTQATALASAMPAELEKLALALGLKFQKDTVGARLMKQMARAESVAQDTPERIASLARYCVRDVLTTREVLYTLPALTDEEQARWVLNHTINARGVHFDRAVTIAGRHVAEQIRPELNAEMGEATGGEITTTSQVWRLKRWFIRRGFPVESLDKDRVNELLAGELPADVRRVAELRQAGAGSATAKFDAILANIEDDDRAYGLFRHHGASTGRASSHRIQIQNLKHTTLKDPEAAIAAVLSGDLDHVRALGSPLEVLANLIRPLICAGPGKTLLGGDLSAIESRGLAWLAHEERKLEVYRRFDRTGDLDIEPYLVVARWLDPIDPNRALGKICDLAFGYQGGVNAFRAFEPDKLHPLPDQEVEKLKLRWRAAHPRIEAFWYSLERAAIAAVFQPGLITRAGYIRFKQIGDFLYMQLPSGRLIAYPYPRLEHDNRRRKRVVFKDNASGAWRDDSLYGGQLAENATSGMARDVLTEAMQRIEEAGIPIIAHIHDEIVCEVPESSADPAQLIKLMTEVPPWASGLPIAAKAWTGRRYAK
jgi:DNA polymerase